jgi:threonine dehydrogenase-like Zn-dependent dehydrogenase
MTSAPASIPPQGRVIGHEAVGQVIGVGNNVSHIGTGSYVAIASVFHCLYCEACRRGAFNQCHNAALLGMGLDGLFGDVVDIPASLAHEVSESVSSDADLQAIACLEPAGTALLACETAHIHAGDKVVVFGGGPIGLLTAILSKRAFGAAEVTMVEPLLFRRNHARQWCDAVYDVEEYLDRTASTVDVVIEASGHLDNVTRVFRRIKPNGRVVLLARSGKSMVLNNIDHMITQAITVSACRGHLGGYLQQVLKLYKSNTLPLQAIVTEVVESLENLQRVLSDTDAISRQHCKILVKL